MTVVCQYESHWSSLQWLCQSTADKETQKGKRSPAVDQIKHTERG